MKYIFIALTLLAACSKPPETKPQPTAGIPVELRDPARLWCKEHDRYEDRCWLCHPELQDKNRPYCDEHGLYEDECFLCHPELKPERQAAADRLLCKEHGVFEDECGICHPELAASKPVKVRFASKNAAAQAGIEVARPQPAPLGDGVECYAEISFNQNKLAQIVAPMAGIVQSVEVDLGSRVADGAALAKLSSPEIVKARLAKQNLERERKLRAERISSERDLQQAEAEYDQLKALGFDLAGDSGLLELRAPFAGEIIERSAVRGALAEAGKPLFTLADTSTMWAMLNIPEKHLARVRVGQTVQLLVESLPGQTFTGTLTWIAAQVDERTRMAKARAEIPNPDGALRAQMFAQARVVTGNSESALVVPASAVQRVEKQNLVFVKLADDLFEARPVRLGAKLNGAVEIVEGLQADEPVVVAGSFIAKSQLLLSRLGAGCVD
jgi:cobalt-zinc-cadmium efflux system membrane fusion protein